MNKSDLPDQTGKGIAMTTTHRTTSINTDAFEASTDAYALATSEYDQARRDLAEILLERMAEAVRQVGDTAFGPNAVLILEDAVLALVTGVRNRVISPADASRALVSLPEYAQRRERLAEMGGKL